MKLLRCAIMVCTVLAFASSADAGQAKKKKKKGATIKGQVVAVHKDGDPKDRDLGTIVVKTAAKKGGAPGEAKVHIFKDTKIEKVAGKKGDKKHTEAAFAALHKGEH